MVQVVVLLFFGRLAFQINWGPLLNLAIFTVGLVAGASSFGIFVTSSFGTANRPGSAVAPC